MRLLTFAPLASLAACAAIPPAEAPPAPRSPTGLRCAVEPAKAFVGQAATQDLGARMLAASAASTIRWVAFGQMVTMEFREGRLTVGLDAQNRVSSVACT